jgi:D-aminopeptidase
VQTNFGGVLTMGGAPVGKELGRYAFSSRPAPAADGSCMIVVATDAPVDARDLRRLAARALFGLARTGASYSHGSGDYGIAFSTSREMRSKHGDAAPRSRAILPPDAASPLFQAALEATEESVYNSLLQATTVRSAKTTVESIPVERVREVLVKYGVGK